MSQTQQYAIIDLFRNIYYRNPTRSELIEYTSLSFQEAQDNIFKKHIENPKKTNDKYELAFIPRDAGFFSVFNFYIGLLYIGVKVYPFYNLDAFLKRNNGENKHFCYWTEKTNAWMDYFKPIDDTHTNDEKIKDLPRVSGENAPCEFRSPYFFKLLMKNPELWNHWRHRVHDVYIRHIKVVDKIQKRVNTFWNNHVDKTKHNYYVIGVHYRHPSHYVEGGKIYLANYFRKVEEILRRIPDADTHIKIYIASDTEFGIMAFTYHFKWVAPFYMHDVERCSIDNILQWAYAKGKSDDMDFIDGIGYQYHYKKCMDKSFSARHGEDLISEVLALSRCDCVVHSASNIALTLSYMNPKLEMHLVTEQ